MSAYKSMSKDELVAIAKKTLSVAEVEKQSKAAIIKLLEEAGVQPPAEGQVGDDPFVSAEGVFSTRKLRTFFEANPVECLKRLAAATNVKVGDAKAALANKAENDADGPTGLVCKVKPDVLRPALEAIVKDIGLKNGAALVEEIFNIRGIGNSFQYRSKLILDAYEFYRSGKLSAQLESIAEKAAANQLETQVERSEKATAKAGKPRDANGFIVGSKTELVFKAFSEKFRTMTEAGEAYPELAGQTWSNTLKKVAEATGMKVEKQKKDGQPARYKLVK